MYLKSFLTSGILLTLFSSPSLADNGAYFTGSIGASKVGDIDVEGVTSDVEFDSGMNYEIGLGYDFGQTRIEASWERSQSDGVSWLGGKLDADSKIDSFLGSIIYDFENDSKWTPFAGASLGSTSIDVEGDNAASFSYGIQGGLSYQTSEKLEIFAKVNRLVVRELNYDDGTEITNANTTGVRIGTRFSF